MTLTVRLNPELDKMLRRRCDFERKTKTEVVSEALRRYLAERRPSPYELGQDLFGRYGSRTGEVSRCRKELYRDYAASKHRRR